MSEYVIKGNTAVLKCTIPSFVADFVKVEAWVSDEGREFLPDNTFGTYERRVLNVIDRRVFHKPSQPEIPISNVF